MQCAVCHYSFHRRWKEESWSADRLADEVRILGAGAIDFHARLLGDPATAAERIRKALASSGLTLSGLSMSNDFNTDDPAVRRKQVDNVKTWLSVAAEVRAPVSRIFGGHVPAEGWQDTSVRRQAIDRVRIALDEVVPFAERLGIVLGLENHCGAPGLAEEQVEVIEAFNSPFLRATVDVGNYMSCGQLGHVGTRLAARHAAYVHIKDYRRKSPNAPLGPDLEATVVGEGEADIPACLTALRETGYNGFLALEYEGTESEVTGVPKSLAYMKKALKGR